MAKDPAVLFYTSDFLTGCITMTDEQVGKYIRLLCLQHQKGSLYEKDMLVICKSYDKDVFEKFTKDGELFYNERMKFEAEKRSKYSKSRSNNRLNGIENKVVKPKKSKLSYDNHMENENENENRDIVVPFDSENFIQVWNVLKRQPKWKCKTNDSLQAALKKLSKFNENIAIIMMENTIEGNWQGLFELKNSPINDNKRSNIDNLKDIYNDSDGSFARLQEKYKLEEENGNS
jgi:hypothetical protein